MNNLQAITPPNVQNYVTKVTICEKVQEHPDATRSPNTTRSQIVLWRSGESCFYYVIIYSDIMNFERSPLVTNNKGIRNHSSSRRVFWRSWVSRYSKTNKDSCSILEHFQKRCSESEIDTLCIHFLHGSHDVLTWCHVMSIESYNVTWKLSMKSSRSTPSSMQETTKDPW